MCEHSSPEIRFASELPYPPVQAGEINPHYARVMLDNVGGRDSELSAVMRYFYGHLATQDCFTDISHAFHGIDIVEMRHLDIFGMLAWQLGADPQLCSWRHNKKVYWNAGYLTYSLQPEQILCHALQAERAAVDRYRRQAQAIANANIQENLQRIILDEELHITILTELHRRHFPNVPCPYLG